MSTGKIKINNLSVTYECQKILTDISLTVHQGETMAIIGESGGGKTTLARCLCGLIQNCHGYKLTGRAVVNNIDILTATPSKMRQYRGKQIGLISQALSDALNPHMTLLDHIQEILAQHRIKQTDLMHLCDYFNLPTRIHHHYPYQLSGGEVQRLLTALALITEPTCLILDEPTAALDSKNQEHAILTFKKGSDKRAQILITHDLPLAARIADRIGVLHQGRLIEVGATDCFFKNPAHPYSKKLLSNLDHTALSPSIQMPHNNPEFVASDIMTTGMGLQVSGLSYGYSHPFLFKDISAFIPAGHCLAILGSSGCGKSTMARLLAGYLEIQKGSINWHPSEEQPEEQNADADPSSSPAAMSCLISQHPHRALASHFSVQDVLTEALMFEDMEKSPDSQRSITDLLAQVGLPMDQRFLERKVKILSGGEAQRLVIARALVANPKYLVADEPTSALDLVSCHRIIHLLRDVITTRHISLILFTHDPYVARQLGNQCCQLSQDGLVPLP